MSLSVNGSNANNPFAYLQSLWQQTSAASGAQGQTDPLSSLLTALDQQGAGGTSTAAATGSSGSTASASGSAPQFDSQVLQVFMALQSGGGNAASLVSQLSNAIDGGNQAAAGQQGQAATQSQTDQHAHHHHFHMGGMGTAQGQDDPASAASGATSQTVANANGSSTTTLTYADGSSVALTTAVPSSSGSTSSSASSSASGAIASNNLIEQLIQMQAQLVNPATTQGITTA